MFDHPDYELRWPRLLFAQILSGILLPSPDPRRGDKAKLLLEEAFVGRKPVEDLDESPSNGEFLEALLANVETLRESVAPSLWPTRVRGVRAAPLSPQAAQIRLVQVVRDLDEWGYFELAFPKVCVDDHTGRAVNRSHWLEDRLGEPDLWPLDAGAGSWDEDLFFGVIEALFWAVARPMRREWHSWDECGWHWMDLDVFAGRLVYMWKVNTVLDRARIPYQLTAVGEDLGQLVQRTDDARAELLGDLVEDTRPEIRDEVRHAVALFRNRAATREDARSAVVSLARLLESRRSLLKEELLSKDEGVLFRIANEFDIRHRKDGQNDDYDPVFLSWVFWFYLATIELTERLLDRVNSDAPPT